MRGFIFEVRYVRRKQEQLAAVELVLPHLSARLQFGAVGGAGMSDVMLSGATYFGKSDV
jgi:hypothetical protein